MPSQIRTATRDDFQGICDLIPDEQELFFVYPKGRYPLTVDQVEDLLQQRMEPTVLVRRGAVAAFADFYQYREGRSVFIGNLVVDPKRRGRGYGKRLILHLIDLAFGKYDLPSVRISVYSSNRRALLLYARLGFEPYAIRVRKDLDGSPVPLLHLRLSRSSSPVRIPNRSG